MVTAGMRQTTIQRLRARGASLDAVRAPLRLTHHLESADIQPPGVPPSTVLIVRRLADPAPGQVTATGWRRPPPTWERAVQDALARAYREAVRPDRGPVPASATSVVFADEAELLAHFALDICRAEAADRWWWRGLLRGTAPSIAGLTGALCERAIWVPAALEYLAARGQAGLVLRACSPSQATAILMAVRRAFMVAAPQSRPGLPDAIPAPTTGHQPPWPGGDAPAGDRPGATVSVDREPAGPLETWLAEGSAEWKDLSTEQALLLGVALGLRRDPASARQADFVERVRAWLSTSSGPPPPSHQPPPRPDTAPSSSPVPVRERAPRHTDPADTRRPTVSEPSVMQSGGARGAVILPGEGADGRGASSHETVPPGPPNHREAMQSRRGAGTAASPDPTTSEDAVTGAPDGASVVDGPTSSAGDSDRLAVQVDASGLVAARATPIAEMLDPADAVGPSAPGDVPEDERPGAELDLGQGVESGLGGVFYLVNLMCHLGLPEIFEPDWRLASTVGPWGVLELLGRALLDQPTLSSGAVGGGWMTDGLWDVLASLDGREAGLLRGGALPLAETFRLPGPWLQRDGPGPTGLLWASDGTRVRLWSERGYLLLDTPADGALPLAVVRGALAAPGVDPPWHLSEATFGDAPLDRLATPLLHGLGPGLRAWLASVLPFVRRRLQRALGLEDATLEAELLVRPARLYATRTHVDVVMGLDSVTLPVRLAGLDRDPGWLPDFGRVIKFHFA